MAVYRAELVNFQSDGSSLGPYTQSGRRSRPFETASAVKVTQIGVAGAYEFENSLSLGFSVSADNASVNVFTRRYTAFLANPCANDGIDPDTACELEVFSSSDPAQIALDDDDLAPITFADDDLSNSQNQTGNDTTAGFTAGLRWHTSDEAFSVGAIFKSKTEFDVRVQNINPATGQPFTFAANLGETEARYYSDVNSKFKVPARFGVGVAWKGQNGLSLLFDYALVRYSQMTDLDDIAIFFFPLNVMESGTGAFLAGC